MLFIHPTYNSLYLLIPNSQSISPPPLIPLGKHKSVLYVCLSVSVFIDMFICVVFWIPQINDIMYLSFSFRLTSLSMIISRSILVAANGIISFFSIAYIYIYTHTHTHICTHTHIYTHTYILYTHNTSSLSIYLSMDI